ncbi:YbjN domain-containing protein [Paracoccus aerodenitrificans]|uniref:YbjN domain-containing protein n=1 Tax=Paracoccus aerodenitrificans TaxID=3017781 RepID=UPI0022F0A25A|nr:YbjN domain-containing protein [Paracoccus aerodenitrificans]WBU63414.1 YbjN domain-containing protein [Paracoccus aerodenitrificans]
MAQTDSFIHSEEIHPIDIVETIATHHEWDFDRLADDQIAMAVEGQWRTYSITLAWSGPEEMLRLICTFDMDPPAERMPALYEALNMANDQVWDGAFTFWPSQRMMVWRYGLVLAGECIAGAEQIDHMIRNAVEQAERLYPAFQLVAWGDTTPDAAMDIAMGAAYGRA